MEAPFFLEAHTLRANKKAARGTVRLTPKQRAHHASGNSSGTVNPLQLVELALVEPQAAALRTSVDLHLLRMVLLEIATAARAFVVVGLPLRLPALGIQFYPHLMDDLEVLLGEILVLVLARFFVHRHGRPAFT